jgi:hypothetical protein
MPSNRSRRHRLARPLFPHRRRLLLENLEERRVLSTVATLSPGVGLIANALDELLSALPGNIRDQLPDSAREFLDRAQAGTIYQAFPGEVNDLDLFGDLANVLLLLRESPDVSMTRAAIGPVIPPFTRDIIDLFKFDIPLNATVGGEIGPLVAFLVGEGTSGLNISGEQFKALLKQMFDITDARAIIPNGAAILDLVPDLRNLVDVLEGILDFDLTSVLPSIDIDPLFSIGPIKIAGETIFPKIEIPPELNLDIGEFLRDKNVPTTLRDFAEAIPGPVREIVDQIITFIDFFKNDLIPDDVFISTLDGPDKIRFERLTGIPVTVYAGTGDDTIEVGGGDPIILGLMESLDYVGKLLEPLYADRSARMQLYGEEGRDTFVLSPRFSNGDLRIDGGAGNDTIVIPGSDGNDIFELIADGAGKLAEIRYYAPDPNGGSSANEIQVISLPAGIQGGQFRLSFQNNSGATETTSPIAFDATASVVQQALEALAVVGAGNVVVRGAAGGPWSVEYVSALGHSDQRPLTANGSDLNRVGGAIYVEVKADGDAVAGANEVQKILLPNYVTGGTFTIDFEGQVTSPLSVFASRGQLQTALEGLANLEPGDVVVSGVNGGPYFVEFSGSRAIQSQTLLVADGSLLTGGVEVTVTETVAATPRILQLKLPNPSVSNSAVGGSFRLSFQSGGTTETTPDIPADATAEQVRAALENLPSLGADNVNVSLVASPPGQPRQWNVELTGLAAADGQPLLGVDPSRLTGGIDIVVNANPATAINEQQRIPSPYAAGARGGTFRLTVNNGLIARTTAALSFDATVTEIQTALEQLASIGGAEQLIVRGVTRGPWEATFVGSLAGTDLPLISLDGSDLTRPADPALIDEVTQGGPGTDEVQSITLDPLTFTGNFRLAFEGVFSDPLPFNASAAHVQAELAALSTIGIGNVLVTGAPGGPWQVRFTSGLGAQDVNALTADVSGLIAHVNMPAVVELTQGVSGTNETQQIALSRPANGGGFTLTFEGETTAAISYNATAQAIAAALVALPNVAPTDLQVTGTPGDWLVEWVGRRAGKQSPAPGTISGEASLLTGGFPGAGAFSVLETNPGTDEVQTIVFDPLVAANGGTFRVRLGGSPFSAALPHDASPLQVQQALESLESVGAGNVSVTGGAGNWTVKFVNALASNDLDTILVDRSQLRLNEPIVVTVDTAAGHIDALQQLTLPYGVQGGTFTLSSKSVLVRPVQEGGSGANERQSVQLPAGSTGGTYRLTYNNVTTAPIPFNANASQLATALGSLSTIGGAANVQVTGGAGNWTVEFRGALANQNVSLLVADASGLSGAFTTAPIAFDATAEQVRQALQSLAALGGDGNNNVAVTGGPGVWEVQFINQLGGVRLEALAADGTELLLDQGPDPSVATDVQGGNGMPRLLTRSVFQSLRDMERLVVLGGQGDDRLIVRGAAGFSQGILFDGSDGIDYLELESNAGAPQFVAPVFPGDDQATLTMDGQNVEFAGVEGGLEFDAGLKAAQASISGTDGGNEIRFLALSAGRASVARDAQVSLLLDRFGASSTITLLGEQGDDEISLALNGITEFSHFVIDGKGPVEADAIRFEGTPGDDQFVLRNSATSTEDGQVTLGLLQPTTVDFFGVRDLEFAGLGGVDSFTVQESQPGSSDYVLVFPEPGNSGSYLWTSQPGDATTAVAYPPVMLTNIELRTFDTGSGTDTLALLSDNVPGVNSEATVIGGGTETWLYYFDQPTRFVHDFADRDAVVLEMGSVEDLIDITPGAGVDIFVNTGVGNDLLTYRGAGGDIFVTTTAAKISQPGLGDVTYSGVDRIEFVDGARLTLEGSDNDDDFIYRPQGPAQGLLQLRDVPVDFTFSQLAAVTLVGGNGDADHVTVSGTARADQIVAHVANRTVSVRNVQGTVLLPVALDDTIEVAYLDGAAGDDVFAVQLPPLPPAAPLEVFVDGQSPAGSDRLIVQADGTGQVVRHHQDLDQQSGSVIVGRQSPIGYAAVERIDILPLDPVTGGLGSDGLGRLVVFHSDELESNDNRQTPTEYDDFLQATHRPNIDPGSDASVAGLGFSVPGDEDWYRFVAPRTGTLRFGLVFDPVGMLANGNPGLPGDGQLRIDVYDAQGLAIPRLTGETETTHTVGVQAGAVYTLRVRGLTPDAINVYDLEVADLDDIGPQVTALGLEDDPSTVRDESTHNLFAPKPETDGPTPPIHSLVIALQDGDIRRPGFLYEALDPTIAAAAGHYRLVGDHNGIIPIQNIRVINAPVQAGQIATATVVLEFAEPLPDDRFTLTVFDNLSDPVGNPLDGESNASEPRDLPQFPSGDGHVLGDFVARFTVDSRPEISVTSTTRVYADINGNFIFDPAGGGDSTHRDLIFQFGTVSDAMFAGDFAPQAAQSSSGFDKLGAFGWDPFVQKYRFLLDFNHNGVPDFQSFANVSSSAMPVAGDFAPAHPGDEIGLFAGNIWYLDTNGDNVLDVFVDQAIPTAMRGIPAVGDVNGDGVDDLITYDAGADTFYFDLNRDGVADDSLKFGIPDFNERPVVGDLNLDGVDDLGLWVAGSADRISAGKAEWYFLLSDRTIVGTPNTLQLASALFDPFSPDPLGNDLYANFGDRYSLPILGNFDPPVTNDGTVIDGGHQLSHTNPIDALDVTGDNVITPRDALIVINFLNQYGAIELPKLMVEFEPVAPFVDVNGNGFVSALDALLVINWLNRAGSAGGEGEAEGEGPATGAMPRGVMILADELGLPQNAATARRAAGGTGSRVAVASIQAETQVVARSPFDDPRMAWENWIPLSAMETGRPVLAGGSRAVVESEELRESLDLLAPDVGSFWSKWGQT